MRKDPPSIFIGLPPPRTGPAVPRSFFLWLSVALFVVGAELTVYNGLVFGRELRARAWPTTDARVVSVKTSEDSVGRFEAPLAGPHVEERFHLVYAFIVGGTDYTGIRVGVRPAAARVGGRRDRFGVGQSITIHYNPDSPDDSVIDTSLSAANGIGTAVGALLVLIAIRTYRRHMTPESAVDANEY